MSERANRTVVEGREAVKGILRQEDPRLLIIVGPCSIHDVDGALEEYVGEAMGWSVVGDGVTSFSASQSRPDTVLALVGGALEQHSGTGAHAAWQPIL